MLRRGVVAVVHGDLNISILERPFQVIEIQQMPPVVLEKIGRQCVRRGSIPCALLGSDIMVLDESL